MTITALNNHKINVKDIDDVQTARLYYVDAQRFIYCVEALMIDGTTIIISEHHTIRDAHQKKIDVITTINKMESFALRTNKAHLTRRERERNLCNQQKISPLKQPVSM